MCVVLDAVARSGTPPNDSRDTTAKVLPFTKPVGPAGSIRSSVGLRACTRTPLKVASPVVAGYGLVIDPWTFAWGELVLLPVLIALASLVGFVPGMTAYRTDVARTLSD